MTKNTSVDDSTASHYVALRMYARDDTPEQLAAEVDRLANHAEYPATSTHLDATTNTWFVCWEWNDDADPAIVTTLDGLSSRSIDDPPGISGVECHSGEPLSLPRASNLLEEYQQAKWHLLALDGKRITRRGWTNPETPPDTDFRGKNIGVLLGAASNNLGDIDLDGRHTPQLANIVFRELPASGRARKPYSHRWFRFTDKCKTKKFSLTSAQVEALRLQPDADGKAMMVEVRGDGAQTMIPRSTHPDTGEKIEWMPQFVAEPPGMAHADAVVRAGCVASLAVIALRWPEQGTRDDAAMALAGALARLDWVTPELCDELVAAVAELGGDTEPRGNKARQTFEKLGDGAEVTGLERLFEIVGITGTLKRTLRTWLYGSHEHEQPSNSILIADGLLPQIVDACLSGLRDVYQRDGALVRVGVNRELEDEHRVVTKVNINWLREHLTRELSFVKLKNHNFAPTNLPRDYALTIIDRGEWDVPVLRGVVQTPVLLADGDIINAPGYHPDVGLYFDGEPFVGIPVYPTRDDALSALDTLVVPFREYKFTDPDGLSVLLSATLSTLARNLLSTVPAHGIDATAPGSGKGKAAQAISVICTGSTPMTINLVPSQDENDKRIATALFSATPILLIDNVSEPFGGDLLCSVTTEPEVQVRKLGGNQSGRITNTSTLILTGNNLRAKGDMARRVVMARVDPGVANPHLVQFPFDPVRVAMARRRDLVVAGITILRAYILAGKPSLPRAIGSFEDWSLVRGALRWVGQSDPADSMERVLDADPERETLENLMEMWHGLFGDARVTLRQMQSRGVEADTLLDFLSEHSGADTARFNAVVIGRWLSRYDGRIVETDDGNLRLDKFPVRGRAAEWRVGRCDAL